MPPLLCSVPRMRKLINISLATAFIFSLTALPSFAQNEESPHTRYNNCMSLAERSPDKAINQALVWQNEHGGIPARHCEAVGLFYMQEYGEAAARLELIAEDMRRGRQMPLRGGRRTAATVSMLADMYDQAANAWLLEGEVGRAASAIDTALSLGVKDKMQKSGLLVDRARIAAVDEDYSMALGDLEQAVLLDPGRKDILVLIASSARGIGNYSKAEAAISEYISLFPDSAEGHLERGNLYDVQGEKAMARQSWMAALALEEVGETADAARANLERIDVNKSKDSSP